LVTISAAECENLLTVWNGLFFWVSGSNFASFLEDVNYQVSSVTADVEFLETMTTDTISFEELLANCTELYKQTEAGISVLETQLVQYGYIPGSQQVVDPKHVEPFFS
jgi:hypothetical protein